MANPAADPKAAPLAEDLKDFALTLPTTVFPKGFFCALCSQLAIDSYKLLCCNKVICPPCQGKLAFPTTCPSCDHSPLEADSCTPNKALRNTMRVWLQKQKKKEEAKAAAQAPPAAVETTPAAPEVQPVGEAADKPVESIEETPNAEGNNGEETAVESGADAIQTAGSAAPQPNEDSTVPRAHDAERRGSTNSQTVDKSVEPSATDALASEQNATNGPNVGMVNNNPMVANGMSGQMGYGFPNQAGFNNGLGYNMNGMSNMMGNGNWNGMNPMDFNNNMNGMYGNYGGNMGMGMNDMSAMNYSGGYGGWNGMGGGYGNYNNGFNQMGGYNQSGAYPDMMNQYPKNNFPNQNQNRFSANQGGAHAQQNMRNGSHGSLGPGLQKSNSRPGSQSGPAHKRDGQSPDGHASTATDAKNGDEQVDTSTELTEEGKANGEGNTASIDSEVGQIGLSGNVNNATGDATDTAGTEANVTPETGGLKPIQAFDSGDADMNDFNQPMMGNDMAYQQGMMGQGFDQSHMNPMYNPNMNMGYNNYGPRGGYNSGAYGAAKVLIDQPAEPIGVGVVGAPTGPRAMREGRPNTGFSSRVNSARFVPPPKSVTSTHDTVPISPHRRARSRSPLRDESMRIKNKSPSRSRSRSPVRDEKRDEYRERSRSADRQSRREDRGRSATPKVEADFDHRKERTTRDSSRYEEREPEYEETRREDRKSRGDRTRTASVESKYRSSHRDKDKHRSSRSHRDRSKDHRHRHHSRSRGDEKYDDDEVYTTGDKGSDGSSRRKRSEKDRYRERSRDRDSERDRKDRKEKDRDYDYDRSRDKDKDRKRRRDRDAEDDVRDHDDDKHRSSRRSRKDRDRERSSRHGELARDDRDDRDDRDERDDKHDKHDKHDREEDIVAAMMKKRAASPPPNAPTGPSANGFTIKGRSKTVMPPPVAPPTGPRAFQPPKGPAADRRSESKDQHRRRKSSTSDVNDASTPQDHYAAERERHARERDSRDKPGKTPSSLNARMSSRPKRELDDVEPPVKAPPSGPSSHRDKRRKSGATGDDNISRLFTAGLRKNAKARRGGVRVEGGEQGELERVERERERR